MATLLTGNTLSLAQQSLENTLTWANSSNGSVVHSTDFAYDDTHSLQLTAIASGGAQFTTGTGANAITSGIQIGTAFTAAARVRSATARTIRCIANYYNGSTLISQNDIALGTSITGGFGYVSASGFIAPASTTKIEIIFRASGNAAGEVHYFDQLYFGYMNQSPTVNAGADQSVAAGATVLLNGSATDADGDTPLTYSWTIDAAYTGPAISITDANALTASFTAPSGVSGYTIPVNLMVTDAASNVTTDQLIVTVGATTSGLLMGNRLTVAQQSLEGALNWPTTANSSIAIDTTFSYDGTHSLKMTAIGTGGAQFGSGTGANVATGTFLAGSSFTASARVRSSAARTIRCIANYYNGTTSIGQQNIVLGTSSTSGFAYMSSNTFVIPVGTTKVEVIFNAGGNAAGDVHYFDQLYFGYINQAPSVDAGLPQAVAPGETITLTATATDIEGESLTYQWAVDAAYSGPALTLTTPTALSTSFVAPGSINGYVIPVNFVATDASSNVSSTQVVVTVYPGPWVFRREGGVWVRRKIYRRSGGTWLWP